jgi:hypothetical protein
MMASSHEKIGKAKGKGARRKKRTENEKGDRWN